MSAKSVIPVYMPPADADHICRSITQDVAAQKRAARTSSVVTLSILYTPRLLD